jgi:RNA-directed DNA polymerase
MQAKLHRWAAADRGRRFDDLFNFVCDPATLIVAFDRVAGNTGSRTAGVDGLTVAHVEEQVGVPGFLDDLRAQLKTGTFRPLPVRERKIPKPGGSGKVKAIRRLGIPTVTAKCRAPRRIFGSGADCSSVSCAGRSPASGAVRQATWP